jgi:transposase-like protein
MQTSVRVMDRDRLAVFLAEGLSLEQIGALVGKHPTTVAYWLAKHDLQAVNSERCAPKGGLARDRLEALIASGATYDRMAADLGVSTGTVRYWMRRYGLCNQESARRAAARVAKDQGVVKLLRECRHHGVTEFFLESRGTYRCLQCRRERVVRRRKKVKEILVAEAGGSCAICGYNRHVGTLQFHHLDPAEKSFALSERGLTRSIERCRLEAAKCVLLCANCHAEVEAGHVELPVKLNPAGVE